YLVRDDQAPYVQATPDGGTSLEPAAFRFDQGVSLALTEPGIIYYTVSNDGSTPADPTIASTQYTTAFNFTAAADTEVVYNLKYISVDLAGNVSDVMLKSYKIDKKAPVLCGGFSCPADVNGSGGSFNGSIYFLSSVVLKNHKFDVI